MGIGKRDLKHACKFIPWAKIYQACDSIRSQECLPVKAYAISIEQSNELPSSGNFGL